MGWCVFSSLSFITNSIAGYLYGEYIYSLLWGVLCVTSVITHGLRWHTNVHTVRPEELCNNPNITHRLLYWAFIVDKIVVYLVFISGWCLIYKKIERIEWSMYAILCCVCIFTTCFLTLFLYYYGYMYEMFSFDTNLDVANKWHCIVHWVGSFGYHCILLL
jgi:hypothetical protein